MTTNLRITPERAAEIAARCEAATPGKWGCFNGWGPAPDGRMRAIRIGGPDGDGISASRGGDIAGSRADMEFIAAARTDIPDLLADRAALIAEVARLRSVVAGLPHDAARCSVYQFGSFRCSCGKDAP